MSNVRCPMCGKENPAEAEICQHCNARLRPVSNAPAPKPQEGDALDWLRGLSGEESGPQGEDEKAEDASQPAAEEGAAADAELPDWLANIRQRSKEEPDALSPIGRKPNPEDIQ